MNVYQRSDDTTETRHSHAKTDPYSLLIPFPSHSFGCLFSVTIRILDNYFYKQHNTYVKQTYLT